MQKFRLILDTGSILPFCFIELPTSKMKIIEFILENFDLFITEEVDIEMQKLKPPLSKIWDAIQLTWSQVRPQIHKKNPPENCVAEVLKECKIKNPQNVPTDLKVLALGLYLSRRHKSPVFLSTHEKKAFMWFDFVSRKQQIGYLLSPFDILTFTHVYFSLNYDEVDYAWRSLCQFPGINNTLSLKPIIYSSTIAVCYQHCKTKKCLK